MGTIHIKTLCKRITIADVDMQHGLECAIQQALEDALDRRLAAYDVTSVTDCEGVRYNVMRHDGAIWLEEC